ncbi:dystroglycan-like [Dorcoceras hygrometricum]|uniref:Dystroglycan-like n=1 Tax=Dorcoceras hygrometricum TaxID=472368 RepID=A0A2Z7BRM0_9LAMI|nr:dystroglycan-like [Dorcoceras hygrometricum]
MVSPICPKCRIIWYCRHGLCLESTWLRGFLGYPSILYEQELDQFFDTAMVKDGDVTCAVSGKYVAISEDRFPGVFNLPTDGLTDLSEVPNHLVLQAWSVFYKSEKHVQYSCKKRLLKYEFRLLNDIMAKSITIKAGSFDAVTHERFLMMTAIHFWVKINWSKILFEVLKEIADRTVKRAKGFATQICVLLKGDPAVILGEAKTFPTLKILSEKTVNTYVATNKTIDSRGESEEPHVDKVAIVKRKSVSKKKSAPNDKKDADEEPVEIVEKAVSKKRSSSTGDEPAVTKKKRTTKKKVALSKATTELVSVAQDVEPISVVPAERPHKRTAPKRKMRLSAGSDDEIVSKEPAVEEIIEKEQEASTADDIPVPPTAATTTNIHEQFAQLRTSISELSIKHLRTQSKIGDLQNDIFSKIDTREKATAEARIEQDQTFRGLIKNLQHGVQTDTSALSIEKHEFKKGQLASLSINLAELIAFVTKGRDDKKGEVGSSHGRGQPPPGDGGGSGSRSESSKRRYDRSGGPRKRSYEYWFGGK